MDVAKEREKSFHTAKEKSMLQEKLAKAKTRLKAEEQELNDLENEAHRKRGAAGLAQMPV
jgi:hypothetical protein